MPERAIQVTREPFHWRNTSLALAYQAYKGVSLPSRPTERPRQTTEEIALVDGDMVKVTIGSRDAEYLLQVFTGRMGIEPLDVHLYLAMIEQAIIASGGRLQAVLYELGDRATVMRHEPVTREVIQRVQDNGDKITEVAAKDGSERLKSGAVGYMSGFALSASGLYGFRGVQQGIEASGVHLAANPSMVLAIPMTHIGDMEQGGVSLTQDYINVATGKVQFDNLFFELARQDGFFPFVEEAWPMVQSIAELAMHTAVHAHIDHRLGLPIERAGAHELTGFRILKEPELVIGGLHLGN